MRISDWSSDVCSSDLEGSIPFTRSSSQSQDSSNSFTNRRILGYFWHCSAHWIARNSRTALNLGGHFAKKMCRKNARGPQGGGPSQKGLDYALDRYSDSDRQAPSEGLQAV